MVGRIATGEVEDTADDPAKAHRTVVRKEGRGGMNILIGLGILAVIAVLISGTAFGGRRAQLGFIPALVILVIGVGVTALIQYLGGPAFIGLIVGIIFVVMFINGLRNSK